MTGTVWKEGGCCIKCRQVCMVQNSDLRATFRVKCSCLVLEVYVQTVYTSLGSDLAVQYYQLLRLLPSLHVVTVHFTMFIAVL